MIGPSKFATSYLRRRSQERMLDECRIYRQGKVVVDGHKARRETDKEIYQGPCRVWEVASSAQVIISDQQVVVAQTYLSLPWDAPVPESDDIVEITKSADTDLEGRTVQVVSVTRGGGLRASRRFTIRVIDDQRENR